ncbi:hypothetical protein AB1Y20_008258 [Prymnesium parvum]|uniref:Zeta toxin domain-containing protein n=1 Tax=Prymnesium parvum TaxID=97485 RepID=A0AB34IW69_PRYPA
MRPPPVETPADWMSQALRGIVDPLAQMLRLCQGARPPPISRSASPAVGKPCAESPLIHQAVGFAEYDRNVSATQLEHTLLRKTFTELSGEDELLSYDEFWAALTQTLRFDLSEAEAQRVWSRVAASGGGGGELSAAGITYEQFLHGVSNVPFLRNVVSQYKLVETKFEVPEGYDYSRSTNENYADASEPRRFYGCHQALREGLDYSYHTNYTEARQYWQDQAILSVVARTKPKPTPWIVYTCGPMGAGKGYALSWMSKHGYFPLEDIVHIDPDHFKKLMPEWEEYTRRSDRAGDMCHRESGFMQEIAQEVAMRNSQNIWVDGSLRDGPWFVKVFQDVRRRFQKYKIAIFAVSASEEVVRKRIAARASQTGRAVPEHLIKASLQSVASSLEMLTPLSDFVARISNETSTPVLEAYIRINASRDWGLVQAQFAQPEMGTFPNSLAPLALVQVDLDDSATPLFTDANATRAVVNLDHPSLANLRGAVRSAKLALSPRSPITLHPEARAAAGVPECAASFAFAYPAAISWGLLEEGVDLSHAACNVLTAGAFVFFDARGGICGVCAVCGLAEAECEVAAGKLKRKPLADVASRSYYMLQFSAPVLLSPSAVAHLKPRMQPVTLAALLAKGAKQFGWIAPGEKLPDVGLPSLAGAFVYDMVDRTILFSVVDEYSMRAPFF